MDKEKNLGLFKSLAYSSGNLGSLLVSQLIPMWIVFFYAPPEGKEIIYAPIMFVGYAMLFGRIVDAIADPLIGYFSDKHRSRFGRRIPFIALGAPFLVVAWTLLFYPPVADKVMGNALYLAVVLGFFWFFFTVTVAPYLALLPEITSTHRQRINLSTYLASFGILGLFIAFLGSGYLIDQFGFRVMAIVMGGITLVSFCFPVIFIRETSWSSAKEVTLSPFKALTQCFKNKPFLYYVSATGIFFLGFGMVTGVVPFMVTVLMGATAGWAGYALGIMMAVAALSFPLINYSAKRFGKRVVYITVFGLFIFFLFLLATIGKLPFSPFYYGLFIVAMLGIPVSGLLVLQNAIIADVIDYDETLTGFRREAIYFGANGLITKIAIGISMFALTQLLHHFGKTIEEPLGIIIVGPIAGIITFIGLIIFLKYPFKK